MCPSFLFYTVFELLPQLSSSQPSTNRSSQRFLFVLRFPSDRRNKNIHHKPAVKPRTSCTIEIAFY